MRWLVFAWLAGGCGRVGFEDRQVPGDGVVDVAVDGPAGPRGLALRTDGQSGYIAMDSLCAELTGGYTVNVWFRADAVQPSTYSSLFAVNSTDGSRNLSVEAWDTNNGFTRVDYFDEGEVVGEEMNFNDAAERWTFLSLVIDEAGVGGVYQDGIASSLFTTTRVIVPPCRVSLGQEWDGDTASGFTAGFYDQLAVYAYARTPAELLEDMHRIPTLFESKLVALYFFDDGTASDATGTHPATLVGDATIGEPP